MKAIKYIILLIFFVALSAVPAAALAYNPVGSACNQVNSGLNKNTDAVSSVCKPSGSGDPVVRVIHVAAGIIAAVAGIVAVIIIIVSGIAMITSAGNSEAVGKARRRLVGALIGLLIISFAYLIVTFFVDRLIS